MEGFNFGLFALDWKSDRIFIAEAHTAYVAKIGFIEHRALIAFVENHLFELIDNFFTVCLHFRCKLFPLLVLFSFWGFHFEHFCLADSVVSVEGANFFFSEIVVAESAPVNKADFFFNVRIVLQVKLHLEFGRIGFRVCIALHGVFQWGGLDGDFEDAVDDLKWSEEDIAVEVEFEFFFYDEFDLVFFLVVGRFDVKLLILII